MTSCFIEEVIFARALHIDIAIQESSCHSCLKARSDAAPAFHLDRNQEDTLRKID
jgi:hypothetical protein